LSFSSVAAVDCVSDWSCAVNEMHFNSLSSAAAAAAYDFCCSERSLACNLMTSSGDDDDADADDGDSNDMDADGDPKDDDDDGSDDDGDDDDDADGPCDCCGDSMACIADDCCDCLCIPDAGDGDGDGDGDDDRDGDDDGELERSNSDDAVVVAVVVAASDDNMCVRLSLSLPSPRNDDFRLPRRLLRLLLLRVCECGWDSADDSDDVDEGEWDREDANVYRCMPALMTFIRAA
jgi:hypothetical protein